MHRPLVIASDDDSEMNMCEPTDNEPLEREIQSRLRGCFKPSAHMTIPEMLKVAVPDPDLWPYMKSVDFSDCTLGL